MRVEATVTGDPRVHVPAGDGGRPTAPSWSVAARLSGIVLRGRTFSVRVPVVLRGDEVRDLRYGSRVSLSGRAQESWAPQAQSLTLRVLGPVHVRSPPGPVARATTAVRDAFREACAGLPADAGALLLGLAVGDESTLPGGPRRGDGPRGAGAPDRRQRVEHVAGRGDRDGRGRRTRPGLAGARRHLPVGAVRLRDAGQAPAERAARRCHGGGGTGRPLRRWPPPRTSGAAGLGARAAPAPAAVRPVAGLRALVRGHRGVAGRGPPDRRTTRPLAGRPPGCPNRCALRSRSPPPPTLPRFRCRSSWATGPASSPCPRTSP